MSNIIYGEEARGKLKSGVDKLARAVTTTLGLKGRNVAIGHQMLDPQVVHDGVTVAKSVKLEDEFENIGAQIVREAASKTNDKVGDGTTTATLLAQAIIDKSLSVVSAGSNPMLIRRGIEKALEAVVNEIRKRAIPVKEYDQKKQVATISAQSEEIGTIVADAIEAVGDKGVVTFTESKGFELELDVKEGVKIDSGYASPYFATDPNTKNSIMENANILILDDKISTVAEINLALVKLLDSGVKGITIIGEVTGDALVIALANSAQYGLLVVKPPLMGVRRTEVLEDIATITGATIISEELGRSLESITVDDLGRADRVVSNLSETVLIGAKGDKEVIEQRLESLREQASKETGMNKERLQQRIAGFSGGVAIIKVGASTEGEMIEKKLRVEDAVNATKSAIDSGIVPGGGVMLFEAKEAIQKLKLKDDEALGAKILYDSLDMPLRKIVENAGMDSGEVIGEIRGKKGVGLNVLTMEYEDMVEAGVTDPANVTISALSNAVSVATLIITTDCIIAPEAVGESRGVVKER